MLSNQNIDTIVAGVRNAEMDAIAAYEKLYSDLAEGKDAPESDTVFEILRRADRTPEELQEDIAWRQKRNKKIARYLELPSLQAKQHDTETEIAKLIAEKQTIIAEYNAKIEPLTWQRDGLKTQIVVSRRLEQELKTDCRCEALLTGFDESQTLLQSKMTPLSELENEIQDCQQRLDYWTQMQSTNSADDKKIAVSQVKILKPQLRDLQRKWEALKLNTDNLEAECNRIRQEMIVA